MNMWETHYFTINYCPQRQVHSPGKKRPGPWRGIFSAPEKKTFIKSDLTIHQPLVDDHN